MIGDRGMTIQSGINTAQYKNSPSSMRTTAAKGDKEISKITTGQKTNKGVEAESTSDNSKMLMQKAGSLNTNSNNIKEMDALSAMSELENFNI